MTNTSARHSPEVRTRAVRMVLDHEADHPSQWAAISSIASKIGCTAETLRKWVRREERDTGRRPGLTTDELTRLKALERENRELRQANEILRKASVFLPETLSDQPAFAARCNFVHLMSDLILAQVHHTPHVKYQN